MRKHARKTVRRTACHRGSALMVVLIVLSTMSAFAVANSIVLSQLRQELNAIESKQVKALEPTLQAREQ